MNDTAPVKVTPVTLTKATYSLLLAALDTEEAEYGHNSRIDDARRYLHYRWLVEQSGQPPKTECTQ